MTSRRILIVDDDERLARLLLIYLSDAGYDARYVLDGQSMTAQLSEFSPEIILLDLGLPDEHGFELAKELRNRNEYIGIMFLTGSTDSVDRIVGLELGGDDYLSKPFEKRELLARIRSLERRIDPEMVGQGKDPQTEMTIGDLLIDSYRNIVANAAGEEVDLTTHEFMLLVKLARHAGHALTRMDLLKTLSERNWSPRDRSVDVLIVKLRKKLQKGSRKIRILTVRNVGYKLVVDT